MAEALKTRIQSDLNHARKDRDRGRTLVLSTVLSELKNLEIELGREASDDDAILVLTRGIKQRREAEMNRIKSSLRRIDDGEYGYCAKCDEEIPAKRLNLDPSLDHCVNCAR